MAKSARGIQIHIGLKLSRALFFTARHMQTDRNRHGEKVKARFNARCIYMEEVDASFDVVTSINISGNHYRRLQAIVFKPSFVCVYLTL